MQQTIIHPNLRGALDARNINWFPYCTGHYTDIGQQEFLDKFNIHQNYIAWRAVAGGRVDIAYAGRNLHLLYPDYVLNPDDSIAYHERQIITASFVLDNGRTHESHIEAAYSLLLSMKSLTEKISNLPEAWTIGKTSLESRNLWVWGS